jgi:beta-glucosidase
MSRIDTLLDQMTLPEKLGQLTMTASGYAVTGPIIAGDSTAAIRDGTVGNLLNIVGGDHVREVQKLAVEESRLGVPLLIGLDVVHGSRTLFPIPLAEAGLFDPEAWTLSAREAATEAAAEGIAMTFAPMVDVSRDPRWGRSAEGPGEDPWLGACIAAAKVRGFQGRDLKHADALAAVAKHFCAYGPVTAGREYASVDISERTLREVHLPSFKAAVEAGVAAIMPAFTDLAGIPMTAHYQLLRQTLRAEFGFKGVIISDYNAVGELMRHGVAADLAEAASLALKAGVDIDMMAGAYRHGLPVALKRGLVRMADIDESVRRVLTLKETLGLFEDPYRRGARPETQPSLVRRRALARTSAARAAVLLKNTGDVLPLARDLKRIAVIGPLADAAADMRGPWWGAALPDGGHVTVLEGVRAAFPHAQISTARGVEFSSEDASGFADVFALCDIAEAVVLCVGESAVMSGEAASRAHLGLPGRQRELVEAVLGRTANSGKKIVVVLFSGRPLVIPWLAEKAPSILAAWFLGSEAGHAIADILSGAVSPSGRTPMSWPRATGQVPIFFGQRPSGRPAAASDHYTSKYLDAPNEPLYPFGFGLSYSRVVYTNLRVTPSVIDEHARFTATVDLHNQGAREVQETVFLFIHDKLASVARPVLELRGFAKAQLAAGGRMTVQLSLDGSEFRFLGIDLKPVFEPGEVEILVGPCADRAQLLALTVRLSEGCPC